MTTLLKQNRRRPATLVPFPLPPAVQVRVPKPILRIPMLAIHLQVRARNAAMQK